MEEKLAKDIKRVLGVKKVYVERPENMEHGDFSTNVALQSNKKQK